MAKKISEGLEFRLNSDGKSYFVNGIGTCKDVDIVIPAEYDGLPVTSIGWEAFCNCNIVSVKIGNNVTSIGEGAFYRCASVASIIIPKSVTNIGNYAFGHCIGLESITVDANNPVYHSAGNCIIETASGTLISGCKNSVIPDDGSITSIGECAFNGCRSLKSITIPSSVTSIGESAFVGCSNLASINIPGGVTGIGDWAFAQCTSLASINIPSSVIWIGEDAFYNCSSLTEINFAGTEEQWEAVLKGEDWDCYVEDYVVRCIDSGIK